MADKYRWVIHNDIIHIVWKIIVSRWIPLLIAIPLIGLGTYLQGSWTDRWGDDRNVILQHTVDRYADIPLTIGEDWVGQDTPYSKKELEAAGAQAHLSRTYRNRKTGERISVFMICGYARDVAVHTPDFCYVGAGFEVENPAETFAVETTVGEDPMTFWTTTFLKEKAANTISPRSRCGSTLPRLHQTLPFQDATLPLQGRRLPLELPYRRVPLQKGG